MTFLAAGSTSHHAWELARFDAYLARCRELLAGGMPWERALAVAEGQLRSGVVKQEKGQMELLGDLA